MGDVGGIIYFGVMSVFIIDNIDVFIMCDVFGLFESWFVSVVYEFVEFVCVYCGMFCFVYMYF